MAEKYRVFKKMISNKFQECKLGNRTDSEGRFHEISKASEPGHRIDTRELPRGVDFRVEDEEDFVMHLIEMYICFEFDKLTQCPREHIWHQLHKSSQILDRVADLYTDKIRVYSKRCRKDD